MIDLLNGKRKYLKSLQDDLDYFYFQNSESGVSECEDDIKDFLDELYPGALDKLDSWGDYTFSIDDQSRLVAKSPNDPDSPRTWSIHIWFKGNK